MSLVDSSKSISLNKYTCLNITYIITIIIVSIIIAILLF